MNHRSRVGLFSLMLISLIVELPIHARAQRLPPACELAMQQIAAGNLEASDLADVSKSVVCLWELAPQFGDQVQQAMQNALRSQAAIQKSSTTTQPGASKASNGTTSAVSKPNTPLASLASEYGGITSSTNNQTMTLQTTLDGVPSALVGHGIVPYCWSPIVRIPHCFGYKDLEVLNRFGFGITANTSTTSQAIAGSASQSQGTAQQASLQSVGTTNPSFSSVFAKISIYRGKFQLPTKGPTGTFAAANQEAVRTALGRLQPDVMNNYNVWQRDCITKNFTKEKLSPAAARSDYFNRYYKQIVGILFNGDTANCAASAPEISTLPNPGRLATEAPQASLISNVLTYMASVSIFEAQLGQMLRAASAPAVSFEYDFNKPLNQPTTSTLKLIGSKSFGPTICARKNGPNSANVQADTSAAVNRYTGTVNVAGDVYNASQSAVPGAGVFRDLQAGVEFDVAFCTSTVNWLGSFLGNSTVGLTYYYQDQVSPSILKVTPGAPLPGISIIGLAASTSQVFAQKGPINFVQLKYGLGAGKNVKFPIAVSWSNRTELINHPTWSAEFGVTYDFSAILGSSNSTSPPSGGSQ